MTAVRPLRPEDEHDWRQLWRGYLAFYETTLPEEIYANSFARLLEPRVRDYHGLLAVGGDGRPVGLAHYILHRHGWRIEEVCYMQDLYVEPDVRGTGVGRRLIEAVYAAADANGTPEVYWLTQEFNVTARRLYDRVGTMTPFVKYRR